MAASVSCRGDNSTSESRYNLNPDLSGKIIASNYVPISRWMPQTLGDTLGWATCVIIGEVIDEGKAASEDITSATGFSYSMYYTVAGIKVINTIAGEPPSSDMIRYRQVGSPEVPWHTQVKKGEICVFTLVYHENLDQYMAAAFEESVWYVDGKNKLTSMSDQPFAAKYDGVDLNIFIEDIHEALVQIAQLNNN